MRMQCLGLQQPSYVQGLTGMRTWAQGKLMDTWMESLSSTPNLHSPPKDLLLWGTMLVCRSHPRYVACSEEALSESLLLCTEAGRASRGVSRAAVGSHRCGESLRTTWRRQALFGHVEVSAVVSGWQRHREAGRERPPPPAGPTPIQCPPPPVVPSALTLRGLTHE